MALDSKAFFSARLSTLGLNDVITPFAVLGWTTMGEFAFAANYKPGSSDESAFLEEIVVPLYGDAATPKKASLRRLFFEAYAMAAADLHRRAVQPDDEDKPKKLPAVERAARSKRGCGRTFVRLTKSIVHVQPNEIKGAQIFPNVNTSDDFGAPFGVFGFVP